MPEKETYDNIHETLPDAHERKGLRRPLWDVDPYSDEGDMQEQERRLLITLVKNMFVTRADPEWQLILKEDLSFIRRDLSNLGLTLVIDQRNGVAWAEQVPDDLRGKSIPALRRKHRAEQDFVVHAALSLRRHWDVCEARGETDPHVTDEELRTIIEQGPAGKRFSDDAEKLDQVIARAQDRLKEIGILRLDTSSKTLRVMPTILILVNDKVCEQIIEAATAKEQEPTQSVAQVKEEAV